MLTGTRTFAEFFAGIGLVRAGLSRGGWECAFANDIDPKKRQMYVDAFGPSLEYDCGDIWETDRVAALVPDGLTLATASFPCTDLSLAGHWRGIDGTHSSTFFGFCNLLKQLGDRRPPMLLVENVVGFLTSRQGSDFTRAAVELASLGYWLDAVVIDARAFVPQSRPRVFIIGVDSSYLGMLPAGEPSSILFPGLVDLPVRPSTAKLRPPPLLELRRRTQLATGWFTAQLPPLPSSPTPLGAVLDAGDEHDWWTPAVVAKHLKSMQVPSRARLDRRIGGEEIHLGTAFRRTRLGEARLEVRFDVAGCLRTPRGGSARQVVIRVGRDRLDMRWMTAREYARLQGAGDFPIRVPERQAQFGFGDAVCVPAIEWLDRHLLTPLSIGLGGRATTRLGGDSQSLPKCGVQPSDVRDSRNPSLPPPAASPSSSSSRRSPAA